MASRELYGEGSGVHTPYRQKNEEHLGGAAVIQMVLGSDQVGVDPPPPPPSQENLYTEAIGNNRPGEPADLWHIDPKGLRDTLRDHRPAGFTNTFNWYAFSDQDEANAKIIYTIQTYGVAPAAAITGAPEAGGARQWLAVTGYETDESDDLLHFWVHDPAPAPDPDFPVPPEAHVLIDAGVWNNTDYFFQHPVQEPGSHWHDKFVVVVDPEEPEGSVRAAQRKPRADGRRIISLDQALEFAKEMIYERESLAKLYEEYCIGQCEPRLNLVQVLDRKDQFYYLLRYQQERHDRMVMAIDARFGTLLQAGIYRDEPARLFRIAPGQVARLLTKGLTIEERVENARNRIINRLVRNFDLRQPGVIPGWDIERLNHMVDMELVRLRQPFEHKAFRPEEISVHRTMVWRPSAGGGSMFYPFYLADTSMQRFYVRAVDGKILADLVPVGLMRLGG